jgi:broad specificity phosphatase PhoE
MSNTKSSCLKEFNCKRGLDPNAEICDCISYLKKCALDTFAVSTVLTIASAWVDTKIIKDTANQIVCLIANIEGRSLPKTCSLDKILDVFINTKKDKMGKYITPILLWYLCKTIEVYNPENTRLYNEGIYISFGSNNIIKKNFGDNLDIALSKVFGRIIRALDNNEDGILTNLREFILRFPDAINILRQPYGDVEQSALEHALFCKNETMFKVLLYLQYGIDEKYIQESGYDSFQFVYDLCYDLYDPQLANSIESVSIFIESIFERHKRHEKNKLQSEQGNSDDEGTSTTMDTASEKSLDKESDKESDEEYDEEEVPPPLPNTPMPRSPPNLPVEKLADYPLMDNPVSSIPTSVNSNKRIFMVSHQGRIQCLLASIGILNNEKKIYKFKNCAILSLIFTKNDDETISLSCEMVHEGTLDKNENKDKVYYGRQSHKYVQKGYLYGKRPEIEIRDQPFPQFSTNITSEQLKTNFNLLPEDINVATSIYLMRHGQGFHNINRSKFKSYTDASLTAEGMNQAAIAGKAFFDKDAVSKDFSLIFVSDLKRTSQTAGVFVSTIKKLTLLRRNSRLLENTENLFDEVNRQFQNLLNTTDLSLQKTALYNRICTIATIVLPCSHEISLPKGATVKLRECDNEYRIIDSPNKISCNINKTNARQCEEIIINGQPLSVDTTNKIIAKLNWSFYDTFYDRRRRGSLTRGNGAYCENTNMIAMAFFYMNNDTKNENSVDFDYENLQLIKDYVKARKNTSLLRARLFSRKNMGKFLGQGGKKTRKYPNKKHKETYKRKQNKLRKTRHLRSNRNYTDEHSSSNTKRAS